MIGIDTNILVRFLTADDLVQYQKALKLFETETIFIADTVLLETEWVLRYAYEYDSNKICSALRDVIQLENVKVSELHLLEIAIAAHENGMDFADALHWVKNQDCSAFLSFDRKFIKKSKQLSNEFNLLVAKELF